MGALKITNRFCPVHPLHKLISKKGGVWVRKRSIFYNALLLTGVNLLLRGYAERRCAERRDLSEGRD